MASLRVGAAAQLGSDLDHDGLLAAWQEAAPNDPEPVRRRVAWHLRERPHNEVRDLIEELAARGDVIEAQQLLLSIDLNLGRAGAAAQAANDLGMDAWAARIRLRAELESGDVDEDTIEAAQLEPAAALAVYAILASEDPDGAVKAAREVLTREAWNPEALALEAHALSNLGRESEAARTLERLYLADPAFFMAPITAAGNTGAGSQSQASSP